MQPKPISIITEEYLEMERNSEMKYEYDDGEIFAMASIDVDMVAYSRKLRSIIL